MRIGRKTNKLDSSQGRRRRELRPSNTFNYYSQRPKSSNTTTSENTNRRSELKKSHEIRGKLKFLPSIVSFTVILIALGYALWLQPVPRINVVSQSGTIYREKQFYQSGIEKIWKKSLMNQFKLTVNSKNIRSEILNQYGELSEVEIELPLLGRRPAVTLIPAKPRLQLISRGEMYYVSSKGRVMVKVSDVSQNDVALLPIVKDDVGLDVEIGKIVLPEQQTLFLAELFNYLVSENEAIQSIVLPNNAANEADVRLTGTQYYIKFSTDSDPLQAVGTYLATIEKIGRGAPKEYIDLRVDEKVFYK